MKKLIQRVRKTRSAHPVQSSLNTLVAASSSTEKRSCNYADNYYGDQVCLPNGGSCR